METRTPVTPYKINHICPQCKTHPVESVGSMLPTDPPKHTHKCVCGWVGHLNNKYPYIGFDEQTPTPQTHDAPAGEDPESKTLREDADAAHG